MRIVALLLLSPLVAAQDESSLVPLAARGALEARPKMPHRSVPFGLSEVRPRGWKGDAKFGKEARYGTVRLGARTLPFVVEPRSGTWALGLLHSDRDGDGIVDAAKAPYRGTVQHLNSELVIDFQGVQCGPIRVTVRLIYKGQDLQGAGVTHGEHRFGRVQSGGVPRLVYVLDGDSDGRYDGAKDRWIVIRADRPRLLQGDIRWSDTFYLREPAIPFQPDGRAFMVRDIWADGTVLRFVRGKPAMPMEQVLERRYAEVERTFSDRFDRERELFKRKWGMDPLRTASKKTARWQLMSLSKAKELAEKGSQPLLVHFFSETTVWSYRYGYYTFSDTKVQELLSRFLLVRIDVAKDLERSFAKSGGGRLPTLYPLTSKGERVSFRLRVRDADGKTDELEGEHAIVGWQRPEELEVNLSRILDAAGVR